MFREIHTFEMLKCSIFGPTMLQEHNGQATGSIFTVGRSQCPSSSNRESIRNYLDMCVASMSVVTVLALSAYSLQGSAY